MHAERAYLFRHALLRDAAYQLFTPDGRTSLHALALEIMEFVLGGEDSALEPFASELADHAQHAGLNEKQLRLRRLAAAHAGKLYRNNEAIEHLERALKLPGLSADQRLTLAQGLGKYLLNASRLERLRQLLDEYLPKTPRGSATLPVFLLYEADFNYLSRQPEKTRAAYDRAAEAARELGDHVTLGNILCNRAILSCDSWEFEQALEEFREAQAMHARGENHAGVGLMQANIAYALQRLDRYDEALQAYDSALEALERADDKTAIGNTLSNRGLAYRRLGRMDEALQSLQSAAEILRPLGERFYLSQALASAAMIQVDLERASEAEALAAEAHEIAKEGANPYTIGMSLIVRSGALRILGRWDEAESVASQAIDAVPLEMHRGYVVQAYLNHVEIALGAGEFEKARASATRMNELANQDLMSQMASVALARVALFDGDFDRVHELAEQLSERSDDETSCTLLTLAVRAACAQRDWDRAEAQTARIAGVHERASGLEKIDAENRLNDAVELIRNGAQNAEMRRGFLENEMSVRAWRLLG